MSAVVIALLVSPLANAQDLSRTTCKNAVAARHAAAVELENRFQVGEVTADVVQNAQLVEVTYQFNCRAVSFDQYCATAQVITKALVDGLTKNAQVGLSTWAEVADAQEKHDTVTNRCL